MADLRGNLGRMLIFAEVAERSSFSGAAKHLRLSRPAVSASVAALEQSLGVTLLHRTTRAVSLTRVGEEFLSRCQELRGVAMSAWDEARAQGDSPGAVLRVASPGGLMAERLVVPALAEVAREHGIRLDLVCSDARTGLVEGGFDAAIRLGTPREAGLIMRRVGRTHDIIVSGPEVAERFAEEGDLGQLDWVAHAALPKTLTLHGPGRRPRTMTIDPSAWVNEAGALVGLLRSNFGVGRVPRAAIVDELAAGTLVDLLPGQHAGVVDVFVLYPSKKRLPARVRLMTESLKQHLRSTALGT